MSFSSYGQASLIPAKTSTYSLYEKFCQGQFEAVNEEAQKLNPAQDNYLPTKLLTLLTTEGQKLAFAQAQNLPADLNQIVEPERVIAANVLLQADSKNIDQVRKLLSFKTENKVTEAYRLDLEAALDVMEGRREMAIKKRLDAVKVHPGANEAILADLFAISANSKNARYILEPFFEHIDQMSDSSPNKYFFLAWKEFILSHGKNRDSIYANFKRAYELCPFDASHALNYIPIMVYTGENDKAEQILLEQLKLSKFHSPNFDYFLAKIYFAEGKREQAKVFVENAHSDRALLLPEYVRELDQMKRKLANESYALPVTVGVVFLIFGTCYYFIRSRKRKKS
jgi:predicted Zn-dependent protease